MADLIDIAKKEIGTKEQGNNKTKYGVYTGTNGLAWCHAFVSWCANQAKVGTSIVPKTASCAIGMKWYKNKKRWKEKGYTPKRNDLIYFTHSHVGIVEKVSNGTVYTIEGNTSDKVARRTYALSSSKIAGYGLVANYLPSTKATATQSTATSTSNSNVAEELEALKKLLARNESTKKTTATKETYEIESIKPNNNLKYTLFFTHDKKRWNIPVADGVKISFERKGTPGKMEFKTIIDKSHKIYNGDSVNFLVLLTEIEC